MGIAPQGAFLQKQADKRGVQEKGESEGVAAQSLDARTNRRTRNHVDKGVETASEGALSLAMR